KPRDVRRLKPELQLIPRAASRPLRAGRDAGRIKTHRRVSLPVLTDRAPGREARVGWNPGSILPESADCRYLPQVALRDLPVPSLPAAVECGRSPKRRGFEILAGRGAESDAGSQIAGVGFGARDHFFRPGRRKTDFSFKSPSKGVAP